MSIFSTQSHPDETVNRLASALVEALKNTPDDKQLERLKAVADQDSIVKAVFNMLESTVPNEAGKWAAEHYIVSISFKIHALLGNDPGANGLRSPDQAKQIMHSCSLQAAGINWRKVNKDALVEALWQSCGIKKVWIMFGDPRSELMPMTSLEAWARQEFDRSQGGANDGVRWF